MKDLGVPSVFFSFIAHGRLITEVDDREVLHESASIQAAELSC